MENLVPVSSMAIAPVAVIVWPAAEPSMVNFADFDFTVFCFDADASWIASVNGEARPSDWLCPPAAAGSAVPVAELPLQAVSVSTSAAPAATRVVLRIEFPSESDLPLGISPDRVIGYR